MPTRNTRHADRRRTQRDVFQRLDALARNLWWTWNPAPQRLFAALDPVLWEATNHNPIRTLAELPAERRALLRHDEAFLTLLHECERQLAHYLSAQTWFQRTATPKQKRMRVAYFCAEFGLHESFPQYAGGLGILAGDHLKSASDLGLPLVGVGLLYRCGYYRQELRRDGTTRAVFPRHDPADWPIEDTRHTVMLPLGKRKVRARIWKAQVGRVPLYLLDSDLPANRPRDRLLTERLYGGDQETRLQQEILLGIGGVQALNALGVRATVFHLNEGHAAFCTLERLRVLRDKGVSLPRAMQRVRASSVFTTHTPVPAGHDRFPPTLFNKYLGPLAENLGMSRTELLGLGRENPRDRSEPFCMTVLALRLCGRCNGVSKIHGRVSREMWLRVFDTDKPGNVPITHITNGIHTATWLAPEIRPLYDRYLKPRWVGASPTDDCWQRADRIPPAELWRVRDLLRRRLIHFIRQRLSQQIQRRCEPIKELLAALETFDEAALTIGFARRFATYKRAPLIFRDTKRLAAILGEPRRPVQLVFAGKAHPADADGQAFARRIYKHARSSGFRGRVVLLEDYDMHVGRLLTAGCDVWLNNPLRPQEASGTSGMKPPLHGGLNCSILDGWWPEAYNGRNGWVIGDGTEARTHAAQDRNDAEAIYGLLESEIVPLFYDRDRNDVPQRWVRRMVASMKTICGRFNTHRMLAEYLQLYQSTPK
ncbi:MAG: alpha-glucan family phosphorylase [Phycisphaerae bacterium]|nr:alpha-glucan family phosphorylase [Phycisphaerae bacterium]